MGASEGGRARGRPGGGRPGVRASPPHGLCGSWAGGRVAGRTRKAAANGTKVLPLLLPLLSSRRLSWRGGHESLDLGEIYKKSHCGCGASGVLSDFGGQTALNQDFKAYR